MKAKLTYLNGILTFISIALTVLILQNAEIIPKAHAATQEITDVNISKIGGQNMYSRTLEVKVLK
jgi:hypothetical protein